ncbi:MAG: SAM-dependent methyltransferase [Bacteroidales bacterium]|nr:SAM-dependent methyltransferase [Bacteroidales bacterium]
MKDNKSVCRGQLILIPVGIGSESLSQVLPTYNKEWIDSCAVFVVEELRTARRFLHAVGYAHAIEQAQFYVLNEHSRPEDIKECFREIEAGRNVGVLSEAGLPCVADPGAAVVRMAQRRGVEVRPLVGPSSLMLALMASGLGGQQFAFCGYLPVDKSQRAATIRTLESRARRDGVTQLFIEAPYRNNQMLQSLSETCRADTAICVACDLTMPSQYVRTLTAEQWRSERLQVNLHKRNTVFLIGS